jgi:hypothetical protein
LDNTTGLADGAAYERRKSGNDGVPPRIPRKRSQVEIEKRKRDGKSTSRSRINTSRNHKMEKVNLTGTQTAMVAVPDVSVGYDMRSAR